jgi:hypothetical protein
MTKPIPNRPAKARSHVVTGLIAKRREIAGQIEDLQRRLKIAVTELDHVESAVRIFEPDIDLSDFGPRPVPPPHTAFKGELSRILIDALKASGPLNTRQLTDIVMKERGMSLDDLKAQRVMIRRVGASLNNWKRVKKVLKSSPGPGDTLMWEIDRERIAAVRDNQ